jgi:hypothetical protein
MTRSKVVAARDAPLSLLILLPTGATGSVVQYPHLVGADVGYASGMSYFDLNCLAAAMTVVAAVSPHAGR